MHPANTNVVMDGKGQSDWKNHVFCMCLRISGPRNANHILNGQDDTIDISKNIKLKQKAKELILICLTAHTSQNCADVCKFAKQKVQW